MDVQVFVPAEGHPLRAYVTSIWRSQAQGILLHETILPKSSIDVIFSLRDPCSLITGAPGRRPAGTDSCFVNGFYRRPFLVAPGENFCHVGVSLALETCAAVLPMPVHELNDRWLPGSALFKDAEMVRERLAAGAGFEAQCRILMDWLQPLIQPPPNSGLVRHACSRLREQPTEAGIGEISRSVQLSERHLRRLFMQQVGMSPARYLRLGRFRKALRVMPCAASLTDLAYWAGYADQAHFCRDFKELAGMTPSQYRRKTPHVPGNIYSRRDPLI